MVTWGDVARSLREPANAALLVLAVVLVPLGATLVLSSEAPAIAPKAAERAPAVLVRVPAAPGPEAARPARPSFVASASPVPSDPVRGADAPGQALEPDPAAPPPAQPPATPPAEPPAPPEPAHPPTGELPPAPLPDDPLAEVTSTVDGALEEAEQAVEGLPLP